MGNSGNKALKFSKISMDFLIWKNQNISMKLNVSGIFPFTVLTILMLYCTIFTFYFPVTYGIKPRWQNLRNCISMKGSQNANQNIIS